AVTDEFLNRLAEEGVRIRTYTLEPGQVVPCAVWADDDLIVTRIRADFSGVDSVSLVTSRATGEELGRLADVAVPPGPRELIDAVSASQLRRLPPTTVRLTLTGHAADGDRTLGEYVLEHAGVFKRSS